MELSKFVESTLTELVSGVVAAQKAVVQSGAVINPLTKSGLVAARHDDGKNDLVKLHFDIGITATDSKSGGGGISVWGLGAKADLSKENTQVNRIQFHIPLSLPQSPKE